MNHTRSTTSLLRVIEGGYCIGCGVCAYASNGVCANELDASGRFQARCLDPVAAAGTERAAVACPFTDDGPDEDHIGSTLFRDTCRHDSRLGYYRDLLIGHAAEGAFRENGASGGMLTWMLAEMIRRGLIDAVVHVKESGGAPGELLFHYGISRSVEEVCRGSRSRYYPIELSGVLETILNRPGRYAVVGLPCFLKAVRRLATVDPVIGERVVFHIGLVCGHLKSKAFADSFGWQQGIRPGNLEAIDFRRKLPDRPASDYAVYLRGEGKEVVRRSRLFIGSNWGQNFFRYAACDYCDDVFAETADLAVGDAWLPEYEKDWRGNSIVIVRHTALAELIREARAEGRLTLHDATADEIAASQAGGLRDRREGLAYRLHLKRKAGLWAPRKRVTPGAGGLSRKRRKIYRVRSDIGRRSHAIWVDAVEHDSFSLYSREAARLIRQYERSYSTLYARCLGIIKAMARKALRRGKTP